MNPLVLALAAAVMPLQTTTDGGRLTFDGLPVPGATITAIRGNRSVVVTSDHEGRYHLDALEEGDWTIRVEMRGFETLTNTVRIPARPGTLTWALAMQSFEEIANRPSSTAAAAATRPPPSEDVTEAAVATDGFLINGSVNNAAGSALSQPRAFGNARPSQGSVYTGSAGLVAGGSFFDARPASLTADADRERRYLTAQAFGTFGGPVTLPWLRGRPRLFVGYQGTLDRSSTTEFSVVPTFAERRGDFSATERWAGHGRVLVDPVTGVPFPNAAIDAGRVMGPAAALLRFIPEPNVAGAGRNHQATIDSSSREHNAQIRVSHTVGRSTWTVAAAYQRVHGTRQNWIGFEDTTVGAGGDLAVTWNRRFTPRRAVRLRYQWTHTSSEARPFFADRTNVSADAGFHGNDQSPENWGPPRLIFSQGTALADLDFERATTTQHTAGVELYVTRTRHSITIGGEVRRATSAALAYQDTRGTLIFTGTSTGVDFADFLLGRPSTVSWSPRSEDIHLRAIDYNGFITDTARLTPGLTVTMGLRWEYDAPREERDGRLANLDMTNGFVRAEPVTAVHSRGVLSGRQYGRALVEPDWSGIQPRLAISWRPIAGSPLLVRAGYGLYRSPLPYQAIATLLARQPPFAGAHVRTSMPSNTLRLEDAFVGLDDVATTTLAVDPDIRSGYAESWQVAVQRDLPASLLVIASYLGSRGRHLLQQSLPNTDPPGAVAACAACPRGFVYLSSNGRASRHAAQLVLRRRLRGGFSASLEYTLARALDDVTTFGAGALTLSAVAQDWRNLQSEWGPSSFDERHRTSIVFQYATDIATRSGSPFVRTAFGAWVLNGQITSGGPLPTTPVIRVPVPGTGVVGLRASLTHDTENAVPKGSYADPGAYRSPASGQWGDAGRNSIRGARTFSGDLSVSRTFSLRSQSSLEWRLDATNVFNRTVYSAIGTVVGSADFGKPIATAPMRRLRASIRFRF